VKPGDLVRWQISIRDRTGVRDDVAGTVIQIDTQGRQTTATVLFSDGIVPSVWINHLEVVDENQ